MAARANGDSLTWETRAWVVRTAGGKQTPAPVSLSQISRAFQHGALPPDVEVARVGVGHWENIRIVLARHAALAPPGPPTGSRDGSGAFAGLELTLTVQRDALSSRGSIAEPLPTAPPEPPPTVVRALRDLSFAVPLAPRLARPLYVAVLGAAALVLLAGLAEAVVSMVARASVGGDATSAVVALLVALGWIVGGGVAAIALVVFGRIAIEVMLAIFRIAETVGRDER